MLRFATAGVALGWLLGVGTAAPPREVADLDDLGRGVWSVAYSRDGGLLAVGTFDHALVLFDAKRFTRVDELSLKEDRDARAGRANAEPVTCCAFSPDGSKLLAGGRSGRVIVWEVTTDRRLKAVGKFDGHTDAVHCLAIAPDGGHVLSGGADKRFRYWRVADGRELRSYPVRGPARACGFTDQGRAVATDGEELLAIDPGKDEPVEAKRLARRPVGKRGREPFAAFSPDGKLLAVGDGEDVQLWDVAGGGELARLPQPTDRKEGLLSAAFTPDGTRVVTRNGPEKIVVWDVSDVRKGRNVRRTAVVDTEGVSHTPGLPPALAVAPDGGGFAAAYLKVERGAPIGGIQVFSLPSDAD